MNTYTTDPSHWTNRYEWNREGTKIRNALEHFLDIAAALPDAHKERQEAIAWARTLLDKSPKDLFGQP